jgi:hypothetical protein
MERQLVLIEAPRPDWSLDDATKETGRRGVEQARDALRRARLAAIQEQHDRSSAA